MDQEYLNLINTKGELGNLLISKGIPDTLADRTDLYDKAMANANMIELLQTTQLAFSKYAEGKISKEELQNNLNQINGLLAQIDSSIEPITID